MSSRCGQGGKNVLVANYGSGSVASLPIDWADGLARARRSFSIRAPAAIRAGRKGRTRTRSISTRRAALPSRPTSGSTESSFTASTPRRERSPPMIHRLPKSRRSPARGTSRLHPDGRFGYVISEMANTVTAFAYGAAEGSLTEIQTISTLPADFQGKSYTAEVQVHPSGKFVYGSNRGTTASRFSASIPKRASSAWSASSPPRAETLAISPIDPTGAYLLAENGDSGTIVVFRIDAQSGSLRAHRPERSRSQAGLHQDDSQARRSDR